MSAKIKQKPANDPDGLWDYKPRSTDENIERIKSAAEFWNIPPVDYLYYVIADLILAELKAAGALRRWTRRDKYIPVIMEKLAMVDYGKQILEVEDGQNTKAQKRR